MQPCSRRLFGYYQQLMPRAQFAPQTSRRPPGRAACKHVHTRPSHHNRRKEAHKKNPQPIDRGCHCGAGRQSHLFEREGDPRIMDRIPKGTNAQKDDNTRVSTRTFETRSAPLSNEKMGPFTVSPHRSHDGTHRLDCSTHAAEWPRCRRGLRH
jgi:hypothetical protein